LERRIIVIAGPTCSGKTQIGIKLAKELNAEIISADSRQIYKYLNIGTAKPTSNQLKEIKHHFINELNPDDGYDVSKYESEARKRIKKIYSKNKFPIVVGGSGLYIKALSDGIVETPLKDSDFRKKLENERNIYGNIFLHDKLKKVDPVSADKIHPSYWKRVVRALEVIHLTGKTITEIHNKQKKQDQYKFDNYILNWDREILYKNIEFRVDKMFDEGLVNEVEQLLNKGFSKTLNSLNTVGYKETISFLENDISLERAIELTKRNTRRYAKRQLTWFRKDKRNIWIDIKTYKDLEKFTEQLLKKRKFDERKN